MILLCRIDIILLILMVMAFFILFFHTFLLSLWIFVFWLILLFL